MTKTEIALHLIRCTRMSTTDPIALDMIEKGLAVVKRGEVRLTLAGHKTLR